MVLTHLDLLVSSGSNGPECKHCKDNPNKNCRWCNCHVCGIKQDPDKQLLCDECDMAFHMYCLDPPLTSIPDDEDWLVVGSLHEYNKTFHRWNLPTRFMELILKWCC